MNSYQITRSLKDLSEFQTVSTGIANLLINNPNLTKSLQPLSHRRLVGYLSIFYRYFHGHCSQKTREIIHVPLRRINLPEAQLIRTLFKFHCLIHERYPPTNHHSSQAHAIYRAPSSCFPELYNMPSFNLQSMNLILGPSPLSLSPSFFHFLGFV